MFRKIKAAQYSYPSPAWDKVSDVAKDCIDNLLVKDPKERMSANDLKNHVWIKQAKYLKMNENLLSTQFHTNLSSYIHKKRFRRGVRLIVTLNRMIRAAGLEETAREQRRMFRIKLAKFKKDIKKQQRKIYESQKRARELHLDPDEDEYAGITIIDPDQTPALDYSKIQ